MWICHLQKCNFKCKHTHAKYQSCINPSRRHTLSATTNKCRWTVWISTIVNLFTTQTNQIHKLILFLVYWKWSSWATISHFTWRWSCSSLAYLVVWHEKSANGTVRFLFCTSCIVFFFSIEIVYSCLPKVDQRPGPCLCLLNFLFN